MGTIFTIFFLTIGLFWTWVRGGVNGEGWEKEKKKRKEKGEKGAEKRERGASGRVGSLHQVSPHHVNG